MNNTILHEPKQTWREMADEMAAMELAEARERIADLETDNAWLREIVRACLDQLHIQTSERDRLRERLRALRSLAVNASEKLERRAA